MLTTYSKLLRRTFMAVGTTLLAGAGLPAASQTVTLSGATGNTCTYSQMTVSPNGQIMVTCSGGSGPVAPTGATFSVSMTTDTGTTAAGSTGKAAIRRTGGTEATLLARWTYSGTGCAAGTSDMIGLEDGVQWNDAFTLGASGTCTITVTAPAGHTGSSASLTVGAASNPNPNPNPNPAPAGPAGCPAPAANYLYQTMNKWKTLNGEPATSWSDVDQLRMASGQVATYDAIAPPKPWITVALAFTQGQQAAMPSGYSKTEMSVSKCPGVIDTSVPQCYHSSGSSTSNMIKIYRAPVVATGWNSQELIGTRGCYAPDTDASGQPQKWYVNVRWTYTSCAYSNGCGFSMQWSQVDQY